MKKLLSLVLIGFMAFSLAGCFEVIEEDPVDNSDGVDCELYPTHVDCLVDDPDPVAPGIENVLENLPNEEVTITFWHTYGDTKEALIADFIVEFEEEFPGINVEQTSYDGDYDGLNDKMNLSIRSGIQPTLVIAYPDHIAGYMNSEAVMPLDDFIYDEKWGLTEADGETIGLGDIIEAYVNENRQYQYGYMYSMPFSKSTEVMFYNKTLLDSLSIEIPADRPLTYDEVETMSTTVVGGDHCDYFINYDSPANYFINSVRMWDGGYTDISGNILVDDANTIQMMNDVKALFDAKTFTLPLAWEDNYGSAHFKDVSEGCKVAMTIGSTAGMAYNVPDSFEMDFAPVPQYDEDHQAVTQQGPNIAVMDNATDAEKLAAWLFIKYMTEAEQTVRWSMETGYLPVRYSAFDSDQYQFFLGINDIDSTNIDALILDYVDNGIIDPSIANMVAYYLDNEDDLHDFYDTLIGSTQTSAEVLSQVYQAMADRKLESKMINVAYTQIDYFAYDPAFATTQTTSVKARRQAEIAMKALWVGNYSVSEIIDEMMRILGEE